MEENYYREYFAAERRKREARKETRGKVLKAIVGILLICGIIFLIVILGG